VEKKKGSGNEGGEAHYLETFLRFAPFCFTRGLGKEKKAKLRYALGYSFIRISLLLS
jgi:hypothetical protein